MGWFQKSQNELNLFSIFWGVLHLKVLYGMLQGHSGTTPAQLVEQLSVKLQGQWFKVTLDKTPKPHTNTIIIPMDQLSFIFLLLCPIKYSSKIKLKVFETELK